MSKPATSRKRKLVSQREYARRRGVSHVSVQRAVKSGRISTATGKIDPARADREWRTNTDRSKPRNRITGRPKHARAQGEPSEPMDLDDAHEPHGGNGTATGYAKARAARELYQAQLVKLELDRQRGTLVRADQVRVAAFNSARNARDQLMALPHRVAAILAATEDTAEVKRILEEEIEKICLGLSDAEQQ
jgi:DNA-binding transcriptional regulator YhcF (GntR family)